MPTIKLRHNRFWAKVRVPKVMQGHHHGRTHLERNLQTSDRRKALVEAGAWEAALKLEWQRQEGLTDNTPRSLRDIYKDLRARAEGGEFLVYVAEEEPAAAGVLYELEKLTDAVGERDMTPTEGMQFAALHDALTNIQGLRVPKRPELELPFSEVADAYMKLWRTQRELKETNTDQQKQATFRLFGGFWSDKPMRGIGEKDASEFYDALLVTDPRWARSPSSKELSWQAIQREFGGGGRLSDATMNRHMATLKTLWAWGAKRGYCSGLNPFDGFHRKLKQGKNVRGYVAWEASELEKLFAKPPKRVDLRELITIGMFSGMRLDEIASLRWEQIRTVDGVTYIQVEDAKTPAGNRQVPLHPSLTWLKDRAKGKEQGRVWASFNPEGPGKKAGADAGKEFSRFKTARGFADPTKVFHSFRKNVTRIMERAGVPENEWAQVFGHEKGFTYGRYNPDGITLERKREIIELIAYPDVPLPPLMA